MKHRRSTIAQRVAWMEALAKAFEQDSGRIAQMIVDTIGKPRKAANFEASRVGAFLRNTIAELLAGRGEVLPLDSAPAGAGHLGYARRVPCGVVAAITPFNAPANLLVQKLAPALATGNAMVVKPHPTGIEVALAFAELAKQAGLPDGLFNVVTGDRSAALELVAHPLTSVITLTGGVAAARALSAAAGPKKFCAELGSNAANLVLADANLDDAATFGRTFFAWYNNEHRHSGIAYLTPNEVHEGRSDEVLDKRHAVRMAAFAEHPERYPRGAPRRQTLPPAVYINPPASPLPPSSSSSPSRTERSEVRATTTGVVAMRSRGRRRQGDERR
jgi:acyl-CoA reductase-like NAD-dependent aldehyde dehydrogenase